MTGGPPPGQADKRIFIVAGEASGDALGGALVGALRRTYPGSLNIAGIGGDRMSEAGVQTPFHVNEVAVMGIFAIARALPRLVRRVYETVDRAVAFSPDCVVIIDSPEFTHPIAHRIRKKLPQTPIINYVSPSVWAWRSYRARKMVGTIDQVLGLLPFEPQAYRDLGGPPCVYVGHPLIERLKDFEPVLNRGQAPQTILILPGSRTSEISRLMPVFKPVVETLNSKYPNARFVIPSVPRQVQRIQDLVADWPVKPVILGTESDKLDAFQSAHLAIAASGTVTLELALAKVPMVVCYRIDPIIAAFRSLLRAHSVVLPNLIAGGNRIPELIHHDCTPENIVRHATELWNDGDARSAQNQVFETVISEMKKAGPSPSEAAAKAVLAYL